MDLRKAFATNKRAESEGRKLYLVPEGADEKYPEGVWLLIARKGNPNYKAMLQKHLSENEMVLKTKGVEAEQVATMIFKKVAAHTLLIGWSAQGIDLGEKKDEAGTVTEPAQTDLRYSSENALKVFLEMEDFYLTVDSYAGDMSNYRDEEVAVEGKP